MELLAKKEFNQRFTNIMRTPFPGSLRQNAGFSKVNVSSAARLDRCYGAAMLFGIHASFSFFRHGNGDLELFLIKK
jgi:hypothetical protein